MSFVSCSEAILPMAASCNQLCVGMEGGYFGYGGDLGLVHDDGITLDVPAALGVAAHIQMEDLGGFVLRDGAGDDLGCGALLKKLDRDIGYGVLV